MSRHIPARRAALRGRRTATRDDAGDGGITRVVNGRVIVDGDYRDRRNRSAYSGAHTYADRGSVGHSDHGGAKERIKAKRATRHRREITTAPRRKR